MKRIIVLAIISVMLLSRFVFASEQLAGGWTATADPSITEEAQTAFDVATQSLSEDYYIPMSLLATQVVSGTNYCILCQKTSAQQDTSYGYVLMYIYADLQGGAEVLEISELEYGLSQADTQQDTDPEAVTYDNFQEKLKELGIETEEEYVMAEMIGAQKGYKLNSGLEYREDYDGYYETGTASLEIYQFDTESDMYKEAEANGSITVMGFPVDLRVHDGYGLIINEHFPEYDKVVELFNSMR